MKCAAAKREGLGPSSVFEANPAQTDRLLATRALAVLRVLMLPIVFAGDRLVAHPVLGTLDFDIAMSIAVLYSSLMFLDSWSQPGPRTPTWLVVVCDLILVGVLAYLSGGAFSELRATFLALPLGAALLLAPRHTLAISLATLMLYLVVAFAHPTARAQRLDVTVAHALYVVWIGIAAVLLARLLTQRGQRIADLATARGRLVAQAVEADERARRQVADALHDRAIQNLLTARQDLGDARRGDLGALGRAEAALRLTLDELRNVISELHPYLLDRLDLPGALNAIAEQQARRGGYEVQVRTDARKVGVHEQLVVSLAREFLANAATHAQASRVTVCVEASGGTIVLDVADDGRGFTHEDEKAALRKGHIGLASSRERVEACSGSLSVTSNRGVGTHIRCAIPVEPANESNGSSIS